MARRSSLALCCALLLSFPHAARPQEGAAAAPAAPAQETPAKPGFETVFAQDSLFFLGVDDVTALQKDLEASAWGRLFADEKAEPVKTAFRALLESLAAESKKEVGIDLVETAGLVTGRFGVTLSGIANNKHGEWKPASIQSRLGDLHGAVAAEAGEHAGELKERVARCFNDLVESGKAVMKLETAGTVDFVTVTPKDPEDHARISLAAIGPTLALGFASGGDAERDDFARFLGALGGEGGDALAQSPAFRTSIAARPGGVKLWLDTGALIRASMAQDDEKDEGVAMQRALGLHEFGGFAARLTLDADGMRVDAHQAWGGGWLPKVIDAFFAGGDLTLLKLVPVEARMALALHLDLATGLDTMDAARKELGEAPLFSAPPPEDPAAGTEEARLDPRKDFVDHLDGRIALFAAETDPTEAFQFLPTAVPMNFALAVGVKNAEALRTSLDTLLRKNGLYAGRQRREFEGFQVYTLQATPFMLHYALVDDFLVASLSQTMLQDVLRRKSHPELPSLAADPAFTRQLEAMTRPHALLVWSKSSSDIFSGAASAAASELGPGGMAIAPPDAVEGGDENGGAGSGDAPPANPVNERVNALLAALTELDPTLPLKHLPGGSLLGLAFDQAGSWLEGVSR